MQKGKIVQLNPEKKGLTVEKLRTFKGFENVTDEKALEIIDNLKRFAIIACKYYRIYKEQKQEPLKAAA